MNFFERRRYRKIVHHLLHEARHVRHMREDVTPRDQIAELDRAAGALRDAWKTRDAKALSPAVERIVAAISRVYPARPWPRIRENVEIFAVALAVAMGFRTYIIQPFKIPTGSMQPTLYGITVAEQPSPGLMDRFPLNLIPLALFGERYSVVKSSASGQVDTRYGMDDENLIFYVSGVPQAIRKGMTLYFSPGDYVARGQVLATGRVRIGDHIFVDKIRYNFSKPRRGDIFVFSTDRIDYPRIRPNSFYIKRLAALPGDEVSIQPPYLVVDDRRITEPYPFQRILEETDKGYPGGYTMPHPQPDAPVYFQFPGHKRLLASDQYLPLGDNTAFSYDGRYFGPVDQDSLVGPAFVVYWPFTRRWGPVR